MATSYVYESPCTVAELRSPQLGSSGYAVQLQPGGSKVPRPLPPPLKEAGHQIEMSETLRKYRMRIDVLTDKVKEKKRDVQDVLASNSEFKLRIRELEGDLDQVKLDLKAEREKAKLVLLECRESYKAEKARDQELWNREKEELIVKLEKNDQHHKFKEDLIYLKLVNQSLERKLQSMDLMYSLVQDNVVEKGILDPEAFNQKSFETLMKLLLDHVPHVDEMKSLRAKSRAVESRHNETQTSELNGTELPTPAEALKELTESFGLNDKFLLNFLTVLLSLQDGSLPMTSKLMPDGETQNSKGLTHEQIAQLKAVPIPAPSSKT